MSERNFDELRETATAWHLRLETATQEDWLAFTDWLEADPAHNLAYEQVLAEEDDMAVVLTAARFPEPMEEAQSEEAATANLRSGRWKWGALAASIVAAAALAFQLVPRDSSYAIETTAGETRTIALEDGGKIALNGSTRLLLDRDDPRAAELVAGEALFTIVHDASDPFVLTVGEDRLVDVGTVFNVTSEKAWLRVGVSEGAVRFEGGRDGVLLKPGDVLVVDTSGARVTNRSVASIGSWTDGALVYEGAPLAEVAADLSRATGVPIAVSADLRARSFSGVIQTTGDASAIAARAAAVLEVSIAKTQDGWTLEP